MILRGLVESQDFTSRTIPYIKTEYFDGGAQRLIFSTISEYVDTYKRLPTWEAIRIEGNMPGRPVDEGTLKAFNDTIDKIKTLTDPIDVDWLTARTEKFCRDQAVYNAISKSIEIMDGKSKGKEDKGAIPDLLRDALGISFDSTVGHDYFDDAEERWKKMHEKALKVPFNHVILDEVTGGGVEFGTLNVVQGAPNAGKSLFLCHMAASYLQRGYDVLYITLELSELQIASRIDANLMNIEIGSVHEQPERSYVKRVETIRQKTRGRLKIRQYPTTSAHVGHFRSLLSELELKQNFKPKVIIVDYLNIMASTRIKSQSDGLYIFVKAIAEELRGLAIETQSVVWSATQVNRGGAASSDFEMTDTSDSFGLPMVVDFLLGYIRTKEFDAVNQVILKQLKSRYGDASARERFPMGVNRTRFQLYDLEDVAQLQLYEGKRDASLKPVMDNTAFGERVADEEEGKPFEFRRNAPKRDFGRIKV